jgi:hypothetical protein
MDGSVNQPGEIIRVWMVLGLIDADECATHSVNWLCGWQKSFSTNDLALGRLPA